ncbi:hypothetical protein L1049_023711 [Liquidambar formosana]|uniref:TraB domain-containing protein n=1 Tax=Liquidambar formosana TaxID=63359 RepID=A0AAP0RYM6_LIQFO
MAYFQLQNRLTRLLLAHLNSPQSYRFTTPHLRPDATARFLAGISSISTQNASTHTPPSTRRITDSTIPGDRRKLDPPGLTAKEPDGPSHSPESDAAEGKGFVIVDNPNPNGSANSEGDGKDQRKVLPEQLSRSVMVLSCESKAEGGSCDVYLVGTNHVSEKSSREVQAVINFLKPQAVFLELCPSRLTSLSHLPRSPQDLKVPTMREMMVVWKKKRNILGILYSWFLIMVAKELGVVPGSEFRVAYEEARKYGAKVILGDRPIDVTLQRAWGEGQLWYKAKLLYSILSLPEPHLKQFGKSMDLNILIKEMMKEMDETDVLTRIQEMMSKRFPTMMEAIVHERDQYMSATLLRAAREHSSVVAVVGKGHLPGIKKYWKQPVKVKDLLKISSKKPSVSAVKLVTYLGVAVSGVAIISRIYLFIKTWLH